MLSGLVQVRWLPHWLHREPPSYKAGRRMRSHAAAALDQAPDKEAPDHDRDDSTAARESPGRTAGPHDWPSGHRARPAAELEQAARLATCAHCWATPGSPCAGGKGYHLARFARARRRGLLTEVEFASVLADLDVFTDATVIRGGAQ